MKILLICHFTNQDIQKKINPKKKVNEFAPWISYYINEFKKHKEHTFYIISPHRWISRNITYKEENIVYHFYSCGIPFYGRHWPSKFRFDYLTKYYFNKRKVKKIVNNIKPDVINLIGAENPYYTSTILQFIKHYPILLTIQGFAFKTKKKKVTSNYVNYLISLENKVIRLVENQSIRTHDMERTVKKINPKAKVHWNDFPTPYGNLKVSSPQKKYDFVFFARVTQDKGIFDFLNAIRAIAKLKKDVTAIIVGPCGLCMQRIIENYIKDNDLIGNIKLIGFLDTQLELFERVSEAKISVLPTYNDIISATIIESMALKIPVIAYRTGSIPEVNKNNENIIICEQGNTDMLTDSMYDLLINEDKQKALSKSGYLWVSKTFDNNTKMNKYFSVLDDLIKDFMEKKYE